jgi:hypothetical protein
MSVLDGSMIQLQFSWRGSSGNYVAAGLVTGSGIRRPARRPAGRPRVAATRFRVRHGRPARESIMTRALCNTSPLAGADGGRRRHTGLFKPTCRSAGQRLPR